MVKVTVLELFDKFPLEGVAIPAGKFAAHANVVGFKLEFTVITAFCPEQIGATIAGELATGNGLTIMVAVETAGVHGPAGSSVVSVNVAVPVKPTGGVHVAFSALGLEKVPPTLDVQVALEAAPPIEPFNTMG